MFHIFVALPDLYIVLFHIIKTYSSFWINDIYGIYIEFVILPPISKKSSGLVALAVQIRVWQSFRFSFLPNWVITIYLPWLCCVVWTFLFRNKTSNQLTKLSRCKWHDLQCLLFQVIFMSPLRMKGYILF
jgi:hypothetical protein